MTPPPNGPLIPTELIKDVQQLPGHDAASSAKVHGPKETGLILSPEPFDIFSPNPPTTSPIASLPAPPPQMPITFRKLPAHPHGMARTWGRQDGRMVVGGVQLGRPLRGQLLNSKH